MLSWHDVRREPFRLLFPLGALCGCLGIGHWLLYALHWAPTSSGFYHASIQTGTYMYCVIAGFLMTALPRFASAPPASSAELLAVLGLLVAQLILLSLGHWVAAGMTVLGLLVLLAVFAGRRFARSRSSLGPPTEFVWIPVALLMGVTGNVLVMLRQMTPNPLGLLAMGRPLAQQGFLLGIVLGVGGFMAPRLMGGSRFQVSPPGAGAARVRYLCARRVGLHAMAALIFLVSVWWEGLGAIQRAYLLRAVVVTAELAWTTRFFRKPSTPDGYVKMLWVSLWMIVLGLWGAGLLPRYRVAMLHMMLIGGFSLMTFAVGTMVILSHAGEGHRLREPLWIVRVVSVGLGGAVVARVLAEFLPAAYFVLVGTASVCWLIAGLSWLAFMLPLVARVPVHDAFEQLHEQAKRRVMQTG